MRKFTGFTLAVSCLLALAGCNNRSMDYIIAHEPNVTGIVEEVGEGSLLMEIQWEGYPGGASCWVSLDVQNQDSYTNVDVGDEIVVYFNGEIGESDPLQINTVYAITLRTPASRVVKQDKIPMVMVDGKLYYDTGKESTIQSRCGTMDGEITSSVEGFETPTADGQSNFGTGFGYQYGPDDTIEILMDEKWMVFEHRDGTGSRVRFGDRFVDRDGLSQETLEWLDWYNSLSKEEQLAVDAIPADLLEESGIASTQDAPATQE